MVHVTVHTLSNMILSPGHWAIVLVSIAAAAPANVHSSGRSRRAGVGAVPQTFAWDGELLAGVKDRVQKGDPELKPALDALLRSADSIVTADISRWTVMAKNFTPPSGTKHDYMSVAIYYWPCNSPKFPPPFPDGCNATTGLPWVSHDGVVDSAAVDQFDSVPLGHMQAAITSLGIANYFSDNDTYAAKANAVAQQWFLTSGLKMNPNLNFAQGHPGGPSGAEGGIIDTARLVHVVDAFQLLKLSKSFGNQTELQSWFAEYSKWLTESKLGKGESHARNNHGTWYDAQLQNYALYAGKADVAKTVAQAAAAKRIDTQIMPDGQMPLEEQRTKSWSYCNYNLLAFMNLATSALHSGVDLFTYTSSDGRSIRKAVEYLIPFMLGEEKWPHKQIEPFQYYQLLEVFRRSAIMFKNATFESVIEKVSNRSLTADLTNLLFPKSAVPGPERGNAALLPEINSRPACESTPDSRGVPCGYKEFANGLVLPEVFLYDYL